MTHRESDKRRRAHRALDRAQSELRALGHEETRMPFETDSAHEGPANFHLVKRVNRFINAPTPVLSDPGAPLDYIGWLPLVSKQHPYKAFLDECFVRSCTLELRGDNGLIEHGPRLAALRSCLKNCLRSRTVRQLDWRQPDFPTAFQHAVMEAFVRPLITPQSVEFEYSSEYIRLLTDKTASGPRLAADIQQSVQEFAAICAKAFPTQPDIRSKS